jgi:NAD(P)-dependent dehydrogenase (short-subunit alcohol dehydrogenase family)
MSEPVRTAIVTGAAKRIGRAIAFDLAAQGWNVALHHNSSVDEAAAAVREITERGGRAVALRADLTREDEVRTLLPAAEAAFGPVTLLVNNASPFVRDAITDPRRDIWDLHMETNLRAPVLLIHDLAERLPEGMTANVVNMLDQRVLNLTPHFLSYTLSKSGLWTLTRTLALALAPRIRVNGIGPGPTLRSNRQTEAQFRAQWEAVPLARPTEPAEICAAIRFILETPSLTGQILALDGGEHLGWAQPRDGFVPEE